MSVAQCYRPEAYARIMLLKAYYKKNHKLPLEKVI
jgi:hypothetical protein